MAQVMKTYCVVIILEYSHQLTKECKAIWLRIIQNMVYEDFHVDKRMFLIKTTQEKTVVCDKSRQVLNVLDNCLEI